MINTIDLNSLGPSPVHLSMFKRIRDEATIIEDDFNFLKFFAGNETLVIDVGSNIGAFALAALNLIKTADVFAFEPNRSLKWYQEEVRKTFEASSRLYVFKMIGLSDQPGEIELFIPRVGDWHVIGEASMDISVFDKDVVRNRLNGYSSDGRFCLERAKVTVEVFDNIGVDVDRKYTDVVVKIDVEGFEPSVLRGMKAFLSKYQPCCLVENSTDVALHIMRDLGYVSFEYNADSHSISQVNAPTSVNIVFVHSDRIEELTKTIKFAAAPCAMVDRAASRAFRQHALNIGFSFKDSFVPSYRCDSCGHIFFDPPPQVDLDDYYQADHPKGAKSWYNFESDHSRYKVELRAGRIVEILNRWGFTKVEHIHEFGCAYGGTIHELARLGYIVSGSELNQTAVAEARLHGVSEIHAGSAVNISRMLASKVNVIYGFHSLEHMSDPKEFLAELRDVLADKSILIVAVPNALALDPMVYGYSSYSWFSYPGHLNMWSAGSIACLLEATGFSILDIQTHEVPLRSPAVPRPLTANVGSDVAATLRAELIRDRFLGEELIVVATATDSRLAKEHSNLIADIGRRLREHRRWEKGLAHLVENASISSVTT